MKHPDEHTLAAYALGMAMPAKKRAALASHLRGCHGCRAQVQDLRAINQSVLEARRSGTIDDVPLPEALVRVSQAVERREDAQTVAVRVEPRTRLARFGMMVRNHPVTTGSLAVAMVLGAIMLVNLVGVKSFPTDQPAFVRVNALGSAIEVYGARNIKLWEFPVYANSQSMGVTEKFVEFGTRLADIDGDGNTEVITSAPFLDGETRERNTIRVFDRSGALRFMRPLGGPALFRGTQYSAQFGLNLVEVTAAPGGKQKEILVGLNNDRSPSLLVRLDHQGKTLGEYWHFGWMSYPWKVSLRGEPRELVLLHGANDLYYRSDSIIPALVVLDPSKIVGQTESSQTPGFGFPASQAEVYYLRLGPVNPALISGARAGGAGFNQWVKPAEDSAFTLSRLFNWPEGFPEIFYTFDNALRLRSIYFSDGQRKTLTEKFLTRKTPAGYDAFIRDLSKQVQYWDGTAWKAEPVRIPSAANPLP